MRIYLYDDYDDDDIIRQHELDELDLIPIDDGSYDDIEYLLENWNIES